ncbi:hypothetical protein [Chryseobacterium indoltheticum]|uniref:Uncharacterized protein n=1 Tax=Chryseobacterium indoltheticum TaxID=254 RepID=A0A381F7C9_9FLAO|nr:hypothetical protein [Chryseobacterium indoltheticum]AZA72824.1 hypothetical protein EG358_03185 [Chryseobacterium indoltheticum]SIP87422.1 hypothetical protein SAMN05421682_101113 [Chryseobacterium indoltheticum]SUX42425.1 Uncharacterised protein [Chryseobacterium indoltheticum]
MEKIIFSCLVLIFTNTFAQGTVGTPTTEGFLEKVFINGLGTSYKYEEISGSAYINKNFQTSIIAKDYAPIEARYNTYADQIEFQQNNNIYILPKEDKFSRIKFSKSNEILVLLTINEKLGYFFELYKADSRSLLKKVSTKVNVPEKSKNSYASDDTSPSFVTTNTYFIGIGENFFEVPNKRKRIYDLFPEKKKELESKVKLNNIDINSDAGLIKLLTFL